ncbi:Protease HtpX [Rubripirellula tenax]|uniref:Protease HtpX n=1 Tax=Rubripirellula tenax TaxID=2528015 RepID=A0A5C6F8K5_9BACT|nr:M48 family metalloprotease [Rubripirellula tenax]TWU56940.1 Protease HtpX [Rubripirellula tenax]
MFDFLARRTRALRASARWFALVILTQTFTAVATGVAIGYLLMFPVVLVFANQDPSESAADRASAEKTFLRAFDESIPIDDHCVDPKRVFWFTSLLGIATTATGLILVTAVEHRCIRRDGGWAIGLAMGGRRVDAIANSNERQLSNIVEEVAIAYGTSAPAVFVLPGEPGINAFAAGLSSDDSILCITGGAIDHLDRDELQSIVAHEISHLVHGDTLLGTRLTSVLLGIQSIRVLAESIFRLGHHLAECEMEGTLQGYLYMLVGGVLWPFGLFGTVAATVLTMSLGRSRESLADAEAVARVRNPIPLARAMRKIAGHDHQGQIRHPMTALIAPMLFVEPSQTHRWFSTHPPLADRIRAIDPAGDHSPIFEQPTGPPPTHNESPHTVALFNMMFVGAAIAPTTNTQRTSIDPKSAQAASIVVLSAIASCDGETPMSDYEFMRGWSHLGLGHANRLPATDLDADLIQMSIDALADATPRQKRELMTAIARTVSADENVSPAEAELLSSIRRSWSCDTDDFQFTGELKVH